MSLILDALRKAEAERQRGTVPGLHDATLAPASPAQPPGRGWQVRVLALLVVVSAGGWAWLAWRSAAAPTAAESASSAPADGPRPAVATAMVPAPVPAVVPAPTSASESPPAPALSPAPAPWPLVVSAPPSAAPGPVTQAAPSPAPSVAPGPAAGIVTQVRRLAELTPDQRRTLPPLVVSGSVWSDQASTRFVVLDGQVLREGDRIAPDLVLVKLAPRSATLRWRDGLVEVPF